MWPLTPGQLAAARFVNEAPWNPNGLGSAAISPLHHPAFLAWTWMAGTLGASATLSITLVASFLALGLGVASCLRRLWGGSESIAILGGAAVQAGIPVLNKLAAGHLYYLIALAALAWVLRAVVGGSRRPAAACLAAALAAGFSIIQIQLFCIAFAIVVVASIVKSNVATWVRAASIVVAGSQILPAFYGAIGGDATRPYTALSPERFWELNNSSPFPQGLLLLGYAPHYAERALAAAHVLGLVDVCLAIGLGVAILALWVSRTQWASWMLAGGFITCTALVIGFWGPLAAPLEFAFSHVAISGVFRELYHFAGPAWLFEIVLIGAGAGSRWMRVGTFGYLSATLFLLIGMWAPPLFGGSIARVQASSATLERFASVANSPGDFRFLLWPAEWPIGPRGSDVSGNDPAAYPLGNHASANEFRLTGPLQVAADLAREGKAREALSWLAASGVGTLIPEPWLVARVASRTSPINGAPREVRAALEWSYEHAVPTDAQATCIICSYRGLPLLDTAADWKGRGEDAFILLGDLDPRGVAHCQITLPFDQGQDPGQGWKDLSNWSWFDSRLAMFGDGAITWSEKPLIIRGCGATDYSVDVLLLRGKLVVDGREVPSVPGIPRWLHLPPGPHAFKVTDGMLAVGSSVAGLPPSLPVHRETFARSKSDVRYDWRSGTGSGYVAPGTRWIVFKTTYSAHWHLALTSGTVLRHVVASGYANAWRVRIPSAGATLRIEYDRWTPMEAIAISVMTLWWMTLIGLAAYGVREALQAVA